MKWYRYTNRYKISFISQAESASSLQLWCRQAGVNLWSDRVNLIEKHHGSVLSIKNRLKQRLYPGERVEGEQEGTEMKTKETETWRS